MKNKNVTNLLSCICCLVVLFVMIVFAQRFLTSGNTYIKSGEFYKNDNSTEYNVLFVGSSHVTRGVIPPELWQKYGITSYNLGNKGQWQPVNYWIMKDALERCTPDVVVIDVFPLGFNDKYDPNCYGIVHESLDLMPFSINKIRAINDIFEMKDRFQYLLPMSYVHSNWDNFYEINNRKSVFKGAWLDMKGDNDEIYHAYNLLPHEIGYYEENNTATVAKEYLKMTIELCKEKQIDVLLMCSPYAATDEDMMWDNSARSIAAEYGIGFLDFNNMDNIINYDTDLYDRHHVNSVGARKITEYIGNYLLQNYTISLHNETQICDRWNGDYSEYLSEKVSLLKSQSKTEDYLLLLADSDFDTIIEVNSIDFLNDTHIISLLENLNVNINDICEDTEYIVIMDGGKDTQVINDHGDTDINYPIETCIGIIDKRYSDAGNDAYTILLDGRDILNVSSEQINNENVNRFAIVDSENNMTYDVCSSSFSNNLKEMIIR